MRRQANHALVRAVWSRSSARAWSWVSRKAVRNRALERRVTNSSKPIDSVTRPPESSAVVVVMPLVTRRASPMVAPILPELLSLGQEGDHRLARLIGREEAGRQLRQLRTALVDA